MALITSGCVPFSTLCRSCCSWFAELDSDHAQFAIAALTAAVIGACVGSPQAQWLFQPMLEPNIGCGSSQTTGPAISSPRRGRSLSASFCTLVAVARSFVTVQVL